MWTRLLQTAILLSHLEAGRPGDSGALAWALTEFCLASADGGRDL